MEGFTERDMLFAVETLSKYFNQETKEYLEALVSLDVSVFDNERFNLLFSKVDCYIKLAFYNIINRGLKRIKEIDSIPFNKDKLYISDTFGALNIFYQGNENDSCCLLSTNYKLNQPMVEKPTIGLTQINTIKPGDSTKSLRTLSSLRRDLTNETTRVILEDLNIIYKEEDKRLFTKTYQKSLSWIDVNKTIQ